MLRMSIAIHQLFYRLQNEDRGAGLAEYALLLFLIALVALAGITAVGEQVAAAFDAIALALTP